MVGHGGDRMAAPHNILQPASMMAVCLRFCAALALTLEML